jgi:hypothetical protein
MALGPISPSPIQPAPSRDVSAAQRAFFQAALGRVQAAAEPAPTQTAPAVQAETPGDTARSYRPGKLLDIKV